MLDFSDNNQRWLHCVTLYFALLTGDHVVNLREEILTNRIRYALTSLDEQGREKFLDKAVKAMEK